MHNNNKTDEIIARPSFGLIKDGNNRKSKDKNHWRLSPPFSPIVPICCYRLCDYLINLPNHSLEQNARKAHYKHQTNIEQHEEHLVIINSRTRVPQSPRSL